MTSSPTPAPEICVVHLVRKQNGVDPFRLFIESYRAHRAGVDHSLTIIYKGFADDRELQAYEALLDGIAHSVLRMPDSGFDLVPYARAAALSDSTYLCFLNSFSRIQSADWLRKLHRHALIPGVGIVGATASWGSILPGPRTTRPDPPLWHRLARTVSWRALRWYVGLHFEPFPNPHIRTNAFMIRRTTMQAIRVGWLPTKLHAYRVESGRRSITRQVEQLGLYALVVGADGCAFTRENWRASQTFWCGDQANLMVSDNQTRRYESSDSQARRRLEQFAWGTHTPEATGP